MICFKNLVWFGGFYITLTVIGFVFGNNRSMKIFSILLESFEVKNENKLPQKSCLLNRDVLTGNPHKSDVLFSTTLGSTFIIISTFS